MENGNKLANRAIMALAAISLIALIGGIIVVVVGAPANVGPILAIVTGAIGGIVAIVLRVNGGKVE
jgi:hypothetical protein